MKAAKQISIAMQNKPGVLARFCKTLADHKVNIIAVSVADTTDQALVRMVVDDLDLAQGVLRDCSPMTWSIEDVVVAEVANRPGALADLTGKIAAARVNIQYLYGSGAKPGTKTAVVMRVSDVKKALSATA
jgi:hypothetical protein